MDSFSPGYFWSLIPRSKLFSILCILCLFDSFHLSSVDPRIMKRSSIVNFTYGAAAFLLCTFSSYIFPVKANLSLVGNGICLDSIGRTYDYIYYDFSNEYDCQYRAQYAKEQGLDVVGFDISTDRKERDEIFDDYAADCYVLLDEGSTSSALAESLAFPGFVEIYLDDEGTGPISDTTFEPIIECFANLAFFYEKIGNGRCLDEISDPYDFVYYTSLSKEQCQIAADAAVQQGLPVVGYEFTSDSVQLECLVLLDNDDSTTIEDIEALVQPGFEVIFLDNLGEGTIENLEPSRSCYNYTEIAPGVDSSEISFEERGSGVCVDSVGEPYDYLEYNATSSVQECEQIARDSFDNGIPVQGFEFIDNFGYCYILFDAVFLNEESLSSRAPLDPVYISVFDNGVGTVSSTASVTCFVATEDNGFEIFGVGSCLDAGGEYPNYIFYQGSDTDNIICDQAAGYSLENGLDVIGYELYIEPTDTSLYSCSVLLGPTSYTEEFVSERTFPGDQISLLSIDLFDDFVGPISQSSEERCYALSLIPNQESPTSSPTTVLTPSTNQPSSLVSTTPSALPSKLPDESMAPTIDTSSLFPSTAPSEGFILSSVPSTLPSTETLSSSSSPSEGRAISSIPSALPTTESVPPSNAPSEGTAMSSVQPSGAPSKPPSVVVDPSTTPGPSTSAPTLEPTPEPTSIASHSSGTASVVLLSTAVALLNLIDF